MVQTILDLIVIFLLTKVDHYRFRKNDLCRIARITRKVTCVSVFLSYKDCNVNGPDFTIDRSITISGVMETFATREKRSCCTRT